jgi:hypothetical protein
MQYAPLEVEKMLGSMVILVDTREQPGREFKKRSEGFCCPFERVKLDFGDYSCAFTNLFGTLERLDHIVAIERKMDANELGLCFGRERERFQREFERAKEMGARLYLLIEDESWEKIYAGKYGSEEKFRCKLNPKAMTASLHAWPTRYDMQLRFCKKETTGKMIRDILYYELKELLESGRHESKQEDDVIDTMPK